MCESTHSARRPGRLHLCHHEPDLSYTPPVFEPDCTLVKELSILLADDNRFFRDQATAFLEKLSFVGSVSNADNGHETVRKAGDACPDVILLDLSMPVKTGFEVLPELIRMLPDTPIIVVSSLIGDPYGDEVKRLGAAAVVPKERFVTDIPALLEKIAEAAD